MSIGRGQVERLMKITGIRGVSRGVHRTKTTVANPAHRRHPDRVGRRWRYPSHPDQCGSRASPTCGPVGAVDVYSRMILGWVVTTVTDIRMVLMALEHALFRPIHHGVFR